MNCVLRDLGQFIWCKVYPIHCYASRTVPYYLSVPITSFVPACQEHIKGSLAVEGIVTTVKENLITVWNPQKVIKISMLSNKQLCFMTYQEEH